MIVIAVEHDSVVSQSRASVLESYTDVQGAKRRARDLWRLKKKAHYENVVVWDEANDVVLWEDGESI
jgi:hypothetical protein